MCFLHVLAHVDAHHVLFAVEQRLGERLGQLGLADAGRAEEDERADRAARVLDARAGADDGVGDQLHRLVLADDPAVQDLVEAQQLLALALDQAGDRDAGPLGDDVGDLVLGDLLAQQRGCPSRSSGRARSARCSSASSSGSLAVLELGGAVEVVVALGLLDLAAQLLDLLARARAGVSIASFSASHWARMLSASWRRSASSLRSASSRAFDALSFSFLSAASSISSCMTRRVTSSSSDGIESISVRIMAQASSTRSIALSGRKRSVM